MEINSFAVVEFPCDDGDGAEVEVVPCLWLINNNSKCYWPNLKSSEKISKLVSTRSVPTDTWRVYDVTRVFGTYENYLQARSKANRAVETSDINTDDGGKRKRFVPKKHSTAVVPEAKRSQPKKAQRHVSESSDENDSDIASLPSTPPNLPPRPGTSGVAGPSDLTSVVLTKRTKVLPSIQSPTTPMSDCGSVVSMRSSTISDHDQPGKEFERQVKRDLFGVKTRLTQIESTLNLILSKLNQKSSESPEWLSLPFKLPLKTLEELEDFEEKLLDESIQTKLVTFFKTLGGSSAADMTRRVLRKTVTDTLATRINWRGHNGKFSFEKTKISELVTVGVQSFYGQGNAEGNAKIVEDTTKEWLKQAKNRIKQRKGRQPSSRTQEADSDEFE